MHGWTHFGILKILKISLKSIRKAGEKNLFQFEKVQLENLLFYYHNNKNTHAFTFNSKEIIASEWTQIKDNNLYRIKEKLKLLYAVILE